MRSLGDMREPPASGVTPTRPPAKSEDAARSVAPPDLTPQTRIGAAEAVVRSQRAEKVGDESVVRWSDVQWIGDCFIGDVAFVEADDYRDLAFELGRLQRAVMGEPEDR